MLGSRGWHAQRCGPRHCLAAIILAAAMAPAAAQTNAVVQQPQMAQAGVQSEVDAGLVTQVAQSNASGGVNTSMKPLTAADDNSGAIRGYVCGASRLRMWRA